jgi:hypothetical protein
MRLEVAVDKFVRESSQFLGEEGAKKASGAILDLENSSLDRVTEVLSTG